VIAARAHRRLAEQTIAGLRRDLGLPILLLPRLPTVDIGPAGISIQGTMVNINMGGAPGNGTGAQAAAPSSPNPPDAVKDPLEAATAEPGSSNTAPPKPNPPTPTKFSPSAIAMHEAAAAGAPMVEMSDTP